MSNISSTTSYSPSFLNAVRHTLEAEGYFSNHYWDPGGKTKYGITEDKAKAHGYDVEKLTVDQAISIYHKDYWLAGRLDEIQSSRVASEIFDTAVNMQWSVAKGPAIRFVQQALDAFGEKGIIQDGILGPATRAAINRITRKYEKQFLIALNGFQFLHYLGIREKNPTLFRNAFKGWMRRLEVL